MPLLASHTLILTHSLACLTTSSILLTNPILITSSPPLWLIGEAMHIRETPSFSQPSEPVAALALMLAVLAVVESTFAGGLSVSTTKKADGQSVQAFAEKAAILHHAQGLWMVVSTVKTLVFGVLVMGSYLGTAREAGIGYVVPGDRGLGWFGLRMLNNRVTFVGAFAEMLFWGYLWTALKDEGRELAGRIKVKREEIQEKGDEAWD
ncbi:hypothetical protein EPUS_09058 [Endocarpon pusillum Z07020]|uniref:Uncharacterized protein n=1 Tax=Endocarpon pusillum (strain Z07020 / HMAS-L-300199) TaxID=1263415 RepID=U1FY51_ENDPU|nr:uncharacterized protein EPUS_09058 [Endocarpon pusillum Z07020]ERF69842.1 hypothetical protein EPUS_09058 [Endocarpon pusillum Z07020]